MLRKILRLGTGRGEVVWHVAPGDSRAVDIQDRIEDDARVSLGRLATRSIQRFSDVSTSDETRCTYRDKTGVQLRAALPPNSGVPYRRGEQCIQ